MTKDGVRNPEVQRSAGGEFREETDDGGHLIGTRFGGSPDLENIDAQNRNLNRGGYKSEENSWAASLGEGNKVFVNVDTYKSNGSDRPSAYMGYKIEEDTEGISHGMLFPLLMFQGRNKKSRKNQTSCTTN